MQLHQPNFSEMALLTCEVARSLEQSRHASERASECALDLDRERLFEASMCNMEARLNLRPAGHTEKARQRSFTDMTLLDHEEQISTHTKCAELIPSELTPFKKIRSSNKAISRSGSTQ